MRMIPETKRERAADSMEAEDSKDGAGVEESMEDDDHEAAAQLLPSEARSTRSRSSNPPAASPPSHAAAASSSPHTEEAPMPRTLLVDYLCELFPGRSTEIRELLCLLGEPCDLLPPLLVYGGASTGKTSILLEIFRQLNRPFAYASCRSCHGPRLLFESVLNQLLGHVRTAANNFGSAKKCEKLADFVQCLPDACQHALAPKDGNSSKGPPIPSKKGSAVGVSEKEMNCSGNQHDPFKMASASNRMAGPSSSKSYDYPDVVYVIFDNVELLLDWAGGFRLISALLKLSEFARLPNLGLIFVSSLGPDAFFSGTGTLQPLPVYIRDYTDEELHQILVKRKPHVELYSSFLSAVLKPFSRATRRVTELAEALEPLFEKYLEPIRCGVVKPDEQGKRKLFSLLKPHITLALNQTFNLSDSFSVPCSTGLSFEKGGRKSLAKKTMGSDCEDLDFQLSLCSKYLLVSAFICSRNPPTLDATLFDSGGVVSKKRRRKSSQTSLEKKELERQEKLLKGPGTFPLERLLAIFSCISAEVIDNNDELETDTLIVPDEKFGIELSADVLMQISTLVNANLLYKGASDPLEGAPRYRCNADEELVQMVARSIKFPLSRYLYRM